MTSSRLGRVAWSAILCTVCIFHSNHLFAQAAAGPLHPTEPLPPAQPAPEPKKEPAVEPRKNIVGFWKLNADESDDPRRKLDEGRGSGGPNSGMGGGGRRMGVGFPFPGGGGNGPYGGGRGTGGEEGDDPAAVQAWVRPAGSLSIDLKESEVDLTNDQSNKLLIYTDGRKIQKSKGDSAQAVSAHWNGNQLVTDERTPQGRKASRTLELSPDGRQFYETWRIERGRSGESTVIRYVYDAADQNRK